MPNTQQSNSSGDGQIWETLERVLRPKFRAKSGADRDREESEFREVAMEAYGIVVRRMEDPSEPRIEDLEAFSATVALNVYRGFLRRKYPVRHRLAVELKATLVIDPRLAFWTLFRAGIGGKKAWEGRTAKVDGRGQVILEEPLRAIREIYRGRDPGSLLTSDLLLHLYNWLNAPYAYDPTVSFLFQALGLREQEVQSVEESGQDIADNQRRPEDLSAARELAQFIWEQLKPLSAIRRGVFLLFDPPGDGQEPVGDQLVAHGICSPGDIAEAAGIPSDRFAELRQLERVTYANLGELYRCTPKEVENIRRGVTDLLWRRLVENGFRNASST